MAIIKGWKKEELKDGRTLWRNKELKESISYAFSPRGIAETPHVATWMNKGQVVNTLYYKTKKEAMGVIIHYMKMYSPTIPQANGTKFKKGDKVHYHTGSWNDREAKIIVNAVVMGSEYWKKGPENEAGIYYFLKPTEQMREELYDTDREEMEMMIKDPKTQGSVHEKDLKKGWHKDPGYQ